MPNEMEIRPYIDNRVMVPPPGERFLDKHIRCELIHSLSEKQVWTYIGEFADIRNLEESITVEVSGIVT